VEAARHISRICAWTDSGPGTLSTIPEQAVIHNWRSNLKKVSVVVKLDPVYEFSS
jgi:hypothetical protein